MTERGEVRAVVAAIDAFDARERGDVATTLAWIDSGAPLWRTAKPDTPREHLVSYCVLVDPQMQQLLLVDHRNAQLWLPTGGHVDPGEHPAGAAARELGEELGIEAVPLGTEPHFLTWSPTVGLDGGHVDVSLWYCFRGSVAMALTPDPAEFADVRWWRLDEIRPAGRFDAELGRFVAKVGTLLEP